MKKLSKKEVTKQVLAIDNVTELIRYCKTIGLENWRDIFRNTFKYSHNHLDAIELQLWELQGQRWQRRNKVDKLLIYKKIHNNIKELKHNYTNYSKVLTIGNTHLYMCHPYYRHRDYNKWVLCSKSVINSNIVDKVQQIERNIVSNYVAQ